MRADQSARRANGCISTFIVAFFIAHGILGCALLAFGFNDALSVAVWAGVGVAGLHVVLCVATSAYQLTDTVRPPSVHKKRHLALKWFTGVLLAAAVLVHVLCFRVFGESGEALTVVGGLAIAVVAALLSAHVCVGAKSLLKDVGIDRAYRPVVKAVAVIAGVAFGLTALLNAFGIVRP